MEDNFSQSLILLRKLKAGDKEALNELLKRYGPRILASVRFRLGPTLRSKVESMDIVQEVLLHAYDRLENFEPQNDGALTHYFSKIVLNVIRDRNDFFKADKRSISKEIPLNTLKSDDKEESTASIQLRGPDRSPSQELVLNADMHVVHAAMDELEPDYQEVITLRDIEGFSFKEIGEKMNRSPDALRMLHRRAAAHLASIIAKKVE